LNLYILTFPDFVVIIVVKSVCLIDFIIDIVNFLFTYKKAQNQRIGQKPGSDLHHTKSGRVRRVSVKSNRGNFGRGTKLEK
jgi:hypothetical protein